MVRCVFLILYLLNSPEPSWASSCCGNSSGNFQVLNNYEDWSLELLLSWFQTEGRVLSDSQLHEFLKDEKRNQQVTTLSLARTLSDRWQIFLSGRYFDSSFQSSILRQDYSGVSDFLIGISYNLWPQFVYSVWRPDIYLTWILNLPTGKSIYNNINYPEGIGVTGYNQWGQGFGLTLYKVWQPWQLRFQLKALHLFGRAFDNLEVLDFYEGTVSGLVSYNFSFVSLNFGWTHELVAGRKINNQGVDDISVTSAFFGISKEVFEKIKLSVQYTDQSYLGPAKNTYINSGWSLGWLKRF